LTNIGLRALGNRFYAPCTVHGNGNEKRNIHALVDTGASVTMVRGDICDDLGLKSAGERVTSCVHASHAGVVMKKRLCTPVLGKNPTRLAIFELDWLVGGGGYLEAILGLDILEDCRMELDWRRMEGTLEA